METILLKTTNLTLADLRGEREVHRIEEEPDGVMVALGRVTPREARLAMAGAIGLGLLLSVETGLVGPLVASVAVAVGLHAVGELDAEATETVHEIHKPGMTAREVEEFWILNDEVEAEKKRQAEKESQKAKQTAKSSSGGVR